MKREYDERSRFRPTIFSLLCTCCALNSTAIAIGFSVNVDLSAAAQNIIKFYIFDDKIKFFALAFLHLHRCCLSRNHRNSISWKSSWIFNFRLCDQLSLTWLATFDLFSVLQPRRWRASYCRCISFQRIVVPKKVSIFLDTAPPSSSSCRGS